jgi:NhaP-type Na+/H+ or K+/H+ antiporter
MIPGLAFPYLLLPILLIRDADPGQSWGEWIYIVLLYQVVVGFIVGSLLGYAARKLLHYSDRKHLIEREAFIVFAFVLAVSITTMYSSDSVKLLYPIGLIVCC